MHFSLLKTLLHSLILLIHGIHYFAFFTRLLMVPFAFLNSFLLLYATATTFRVLRKSESYASVCLRFIFFLFETRQGNWSLKMLKWHIHVIYFLNTWIRFLLRFHFCLCLLCQKASNALSWLLLISGMIPRISRGLLKCCILHHCMFSGVLHLFWLRFAKGVKLFFFFFFDTICRTHE